MQYKTLSALLFATAVVAAPKPADSDADTTPTLVIPASIESILETAAPTTWLESIIEDPAFYSSEIAALEQGQLPDWASSLPSGVIAWATSEAAVLASESGSTIAVVTPTSTASGSSSGSSSAETTATGTNSSSGSSSTGSSSDSSSSGAASSDAAASSSAAAASSTSSAGAPAATGGIAMSLAGAAGILGVALAL